MSAKKSLEHKAEKLARQMCKNATGKMLGWELFLMAAYRELMKGGTK